MKTAPILRPDRIRNIEKPFGWIPFRLLTEGYLARINDKAKLLYLFLCIVSNRQGISYYSDNKILANFQIDKTDLKLARKELIKKDLIAYDGHVYQLLSLISPNQPSNITITKQETTEPESISNIINRLSNTPL